MSINVIEFFEKVNINNAGGITAAAADESPISTITIRLKVGQTKNIKLPELDRDSVWELEGGTCSGDKVIESDLAANHTLRRVLPQTIKVSATGVGQRICDITSYQYPKRTLVSRRRIIFSTY